MQFTFLGSNSWLICYFVDRRCLIVKTEPYTRDQVARVIELRATVEGLTLSPGVLDHLAGEGARRSLRCVSFYSFLSEHCRLMLELGRGLCRYCLQLLTPASILASLQGRAQIELEDVGEMNDLFLDAKTSAEAMAAPA